MIARLAILARDHRAGTLAAIIAVQALCAVFFLGDVITDALTGQGGPIEMHLGLEALAAMALIAGVLAMMLELRRVIDRMEAMDRGLRLARGEVATLVEGFFERWGLTPSERDVAMMILKGLDNDEIARLRGTAPGTVRAQSAKVYAKSGVEGRAQLFAFFMEELMADD